MDFMNWKDFRDPVKHGFVGLTGDKEPCKFWICRADPCNAAKVHTDMDSSNQQKEKDSAKFWIYLLNRI